jgi:hypothetical protein
MVTLIPRLSFGLQHPFLNERIEDGDGDPTLRHKEFSGTLHDRRPINPPYSQ